MPLHNQFELNAIDLFENFMIQSADRNQKLGSMNYFIRNLIFIQRSYRKMRQSRQIKRELLNDLWDKFIEKNKTNL